MKTLRSLAALAAALAAGAALAYQVTGEVKEVTDTKITVMKGKERFEMARDAGTKVSGDLKVGSKVTVEYSITAKSVEVKPEKGAKATKK